MAPTRYHHEGRMWPSLETANRVADISNWFFIGSLVVGVVSTSIIVWMAGVKEKYWDQSREMASERIAYLNKEAAGLTADNLALQTVLLPRHVGLFGLDEEPKAKTWFAGFGSWAGTKILIQVVPGDPEAQNLANEIAIVLSKFGWVPEFINETRSGVSLNLMEGLRVMSPASYKSWDPNNEEQKLFAALSTAAISLARSLTRAGLGVGSYPVSGATGLGIVVDFPPDSEGQAQNPFRNFSPKLDGVYLQVGSRPVGATVAWIKQGRPDELGNPTAPAATPAR